MRTPPLHLNQEELFRDLNRRENELRQALGELEAKLRQFEDADRPAYDRWLRLEFGPQLQDLEDLYAEIRIGKLKAQRVHDLVQDGYHPREALYLIENAMRRHEEEPEEENTEAPQGDLFEKVKGWTPEEIEARRHAKKEAKREARKEAKRAQAEAKREEKLGRTAGTSGGSSKKDSSPEPKSASRLTTIYRMLVRKLHPDSLEMTQAIPAARARNLWHEVQEAYKKREADRLITIATWLENMETSAGFETESSLSLTVGISFSERKKQYRALESTRRKLERRIDTLSQDPAWEFSAQKQRMKYLRQSVRRQLDEEMARAREVEEALTDYFDGIGPPREPRGDKPEVKRGGRRR